jgi:hypothetical protein
MTDRKPTSALIWAIHRTAPWWRCVGDHLGFDQATVLTDKRGDGDRWLTDDFYAAYALFRKDHTLAGPLSDAEVHDVIARCRVLRWQKPEKARAMAMAMAMAAEQALDACRPDVLISLPIDSYVSDILARLARRRGVPHFELTASALPDMCMLMQRGRLITSNRATDPALVEAKIHEIADPLFTPSYVQGQTRYSPARFFRTLGYFRLRALAFKLISWIRRDPLNLHYIDAQPTLGHKAKWSDVRVTGLVEPDWETKLEAFPAERRVLFGLQLIPEAAIDYWLEDLDLLRHEDMLVDLAGRLAAAGYQVVVKDHPLQFGFRQTALLDRLKAIPNVVVTPYEVSGNALLARCKVNVTATGTLGLQAALLGNISITGEAYYVTADDFVVLGRWDDLEGVVEAVATRTPPASLHDRQVRIIDQLLRGSFPAEFFSFQGFDPAAPNPDAAELGRRLGDRIRELGPEGENWHAINMPASGGRHSGSPLN